MALDDPNDDRAKYRRERGRIEDSDIPDRDRAALLAFLEYKDEKNAKATAHKQPAAVRRCAEIAAERGHPPLTEWGPGEFKQFKSRLKNARPDNEKVPARFMKRVGDDGWGEGALRNYRNALKQFLMFLGIQDDGREWTDDDSREWAEDIYIGDSPDPKVDPSDLFRPDELAAMWSAIDNKRDAAMFALLYCTWQRNAVVRSFRTEDVETHNGGTEGVVRIYEDALGRKGATGRKPLSWAVGPVTEWIDAHPLGDPDATILCQNHDSGSSEKGKPFVNGNAINRRLRRIAKDAGLDRERWDVNRGRKQRTARSHLLRYTGATRAAKSDEYSESTVKHWGGWAQSSDQLDRYIQLTDEDVLASWAEAHGINSDVFGSIHPEFGKCERCDGPIEDWLETCPCCGHDVGEAAPVNEEEELARELGETLERLVRTDPDAARTLIAAIEDRGHPAEG